MVPCGPSSWRGRIHGSHGREDGGARARAPQRRRPSERRARCCDGGMTSPGAPVGWGHGCCASKTTAARGEDDSGRPCADGGKDDAGRRRQWRRGRPSAGTKARGTRQAFGARSCTSSLALLLCLFHAEIYRRGLAITQAKLYYCISS